MDGTEAHDPPTRVAPTAEPPVVLGDRPPHPPGRAGGALAASVGRSATLLWRGEIRQPRDRVGDVLHFADGSSGRVYRETQHRGPVVEDPATLIVRFRLRFVRGQGHPLFRAESLLNTPLFAGFPGFASKLWLAHDVNHTYRGVYEWDGPDRAESYVRSLWWALALVSERPSIGYVVIPGVRRDEVLRDPDVLAELAPGAGGEWWRVVRCPATRRP